MPEYQGFSKDQLQRQIKDRGVDETAILEAMCKVDRSLFVPSRLWKHAYDDCALPIGHGQTISQPYIVALMSSLLQVRRDHRVLEIGTGSGYQTAILSCLASEVWTIESLGILSSAARAVLESCGLAENVHFGVGDGYDGWPERAPFDRIMVTCAPDHIPLPLLAQLRDPGRLVLPVGKAGKMQQLVVVTKQEGATSSESVSGVFFVPLIRKKD